LSYIKAFVTLHLLTMIPSTSDLLFIHTREFKSSNSSNEYERSDRCTIKYSSLQLFKLCQWNNKIFIIMVYIICIWRYFRNNIYPFLSFWYRLPKLLRDDLVATNLLP
jgi:hypothetical protein